LEQLALTDELRAILDGSDVYAWDARHASHDDVIKRLGCAESAIYGLINLDRKAVRVVRGSQLHLSRAEAHPHLKKLGLKVVNE
jgi:hypothetical protein